MKDFRFIPLLSPKSLGEFTPEEFHAYVRSLNYVKPKKSKVKGVKAPPKEVTWSITKKGTLTVRIKRDPKWLTREEVETIARDSGKPLNQVWLKLVGPKGVAKLAEKS